VTCCVSFSRVRICPIDSVCVVLGLKMRNSM
jgi:hypothetical protein